MAKKTESFETNIDRLTEIVDLLEQGEINLEDSIAMFEEGLKIVKKCHETLDNAEGKLRKLVKTENGFQLSFLDSDTL